MMRPSLLHTTPIVALLTLATLSAASAQFEHSSWIAPSTGWTDIAAPPLFRKDFDLGAKPVQAALRIVGLGDFDLRLNGERVADTGLNQPWSQYEKTIYYQDFDITPFLVSGSNCVGVQLTHSFWHNPNPPAGRYNKDGPQRAAEEPFLLRAEITVRPADGSTQTIGTDASWLVGKGPITFSHIYAGEDFDARLQQEGWDRAGFADPAWQPARHAKAPQGSLAPRNFPGIAPYEPLAPLPVKEPAPGVFLYVFPRNVAAQLRLKMEGGKAGDRVHFQCGEHKNAADRLYGGYVVGCDVITDGQSLAHQWTSFYLGMQFVEVTGAVPQGYPNPDNLPVMRELTLVPVRAGLAQVGEFRCSSETYNRAHDLIDAAVCSNMSWVMTDCPHREKLGWLECSYLLAPTFMYRHDGREWFGKIARDIRDAQETSGRVPTVAPSYPAGRFSGAFDWTVEWGAAAVFVPWRHYEWFGDIRILQDNYDMMRRFTDYIQTEAREGLAPGGLGDWYDYGHGQPPGPSRFTPPELSATATWALCALTVSRAAEALGRTGDVQRYREMHARIAADFRRHFQDPTTHRIRHNGSPQCACALALCAELVPERDRPLLIEDMIADLEARGWQQTPGDVGHVYFIRALAGVGRSDVLHRVYSREGAGSYGGILSKGLTSLPETWDAMMDGSQSLNHCMLGHAQEWLYGYVGGVRQPGGGIGWKEILIAPNPGPLSGAEVTLNTPRGRVVCRWRKDHGEFRLETEVPETVNALAILPSGREIPLHGGAQTLTEAIDQGD